jgi:hypothetical protein
MHDGATSSDSLEECAATSRHSALIAPFARSLGTASSGLPPNRTSINRLLTILEALSIVTGLKEFGQTTQTQSFITVLDVGLARFLSIYVMEVDL